MGNDNRFGDALKEIREGLEMTQAAFGEMCDISQTEISAFETGTRTPSRESMNKLWVAVGRDDGDWLCFHAGFLPPDMAGGGQKWSPWQGDVQDAFKAYRSSLVLGFVGRKADAGATP